MNQPFTVHRKEGNWINGRFVDIEIEPVILMSGIIIPASSREIQQVPEGDRVTGMMCFYSEQPIYVTRDQPDMGTSDEISWGGDRYRVLNVNQFSDFGYYKAFGVYKESD
jgi:hypothetical protein